MEAADRLRRLFDYDLWGNLKMLAVLEEQSDFEYRDKTLGLFNHIIGAQQLWYGRITGADLTGLDVWPEYPLGKGRSLIKKNFESMRDLIEGNEDDLDRTISYRNSSGTPYETALSDILHHLVIHGQHHRSQIAMLLRMSGIVPPPTDFIFFTRE